MAGWICFDGLRYRSLGYSGAQLGTVGRLMRWLSFCWQTEGNRGAVKQLTQLGEGGEQV
ncbi:uncharacterized protein P884DRAFT_132026 [Thermothelomyces heterothallicus CBS 202.75]|uniref:uncharacterized protein n=1 Tax=Thermothelomyces heterothallicus CBS 202.75 TaxID=1149848 RepID=UPI003744585B